MKKIDGELLQECINVLGNAEINSTNEVALQFSEDYLLETYDKYLIFCENTGFEPISRNEYLLELLSFSEDVPAPQNNNTASKPSQPNTGGAVKPAVGSQAPQQNSQQSSNANNGGANQQQQSQADKSQEKADNAQQNADLEKKKADIDKQIEALNQKKAQLANNSSSGGGQPGQNKPLKEEYQPLTPSVKMPRKFE